MIHGAWPSGAPTKCWPRQDRQVPCCRVVPSTNHTTSTIVLLYAWPRGFKGGGGVVVQGRVRGGFPRGKKGRGGGGATHRFGLMRRNRTGSGVLPCGVMRNTMHRTQKGVCSCPPTPPTQRSSERAHPNTAAHREHRRCGYRMRSPPARRHLMCPWAATMHGG